MIGLGSVVRVALGAAAVACLSLVPSDALASSMNVAPIPIVISGGATSTLVEVTDEGDAPIRVQVLAFDWSQTAAGEDKLTPSTEILVFPSILSIKPGEPRRIRVGTQGGYGPIEKTFRLLFAELPPDSSSVDPQAESVAIVTHMSIPVFVTPAGAVPMTAIEGLSATKDHVRFAVRNGGTAHALLSKVTVEFRGDKGAPLGTKDVPGWYVLPGQVRAFDVDLGAAPGCAKAKKLVVTATSGPGLTSSATLDRPACAG